MWQLEFELPKNAPIGCEDALSEAFETMLIFETEDKAAWDIKIILTEEPTHEIDDKIYAITDSFGLERPEIDAIKVQERDWLAENRKDFPAMTIAGFFIHGSHLPKSNDDDLIPIQVDASLAFGTGEHATTRGCLEMIAELEEPPAGGSILDLGCGTAILAIAMAKIWNREIWASDIDEDSAMMAWQNCIDNYVGNLVHAFQADGFNHPILEEQAPFSLIVANILADPLCRLSPEVRKNMADGGQLLLSGLLVEQKDLVQKTYEENGFRLVAERIIGEWATLLFKVA
jgi:ribosomal protein L11 methyltransferase